ncbi:VOC family protein [Cupriavidus sp. SS-3]|uniref:VOC family protein n=1 Tax=Cupriavidus sp. SS-3 TaxID=3109596 RepID=UPI002DBCDB97|nr:VOC family protein [Cupriavidus sp. SS-3]MEC3766050.1 VOC family protein [Cupriavidus sp. SS-3]
MIAGPKVLGLNGFGLEVPDLAAARTFYETFGLEVAAQPGPDQPSGALRLRSPGRSNDELVLVPGSAKRLHHLSFYFDPLQRDAFADRLGRAGLAVRDQPPPGGGRDGLWFQDPWGTWIHLCPQLPASTRRREGGPGDAGWAARVDVAAWQALEAPRPPRKLGHVLIFTPQLAEAERFLCDVLGLRVADRAVGKVSFLAAGEGVIDHHCFGLVHSTHRGFQHASFQVGGIDDIGLGAWRMREAGYRDSFGPGRHALASNLFQYVRDPWGSWVEYYADMDKISERWVSRDWSVLPYIWGPEWSPEFWGGEMNANLEPR